MYLIYGENNMGKEDKYLNEKGMYKIQILDLKNKWVDEIPKGKYSKSDAELIMKKNIQRGKKKDMIRVVPESIENDMDVLDKIEVEELIRETKQFLDDDELSEKAIATAGWDKSSVEKFGKTIGISPSKHGFIKGCVAKMEGKSGWDKKKAGGFCASLVDTYKGSTEWRKGPRK